MTLAISATNAKRGAVQMMKTKADRIVVNLTTAFSNVLGIKTAMEWVAAAQMVFAPRM